MTLTEIINAAKGGRTARVWYDAVLATREEGDPSPTRQALEHYTRGFRVPEPAIFRLILRESDFAEDDREAWAAWAVAKGAPVGALGGEALTEGAA